MYQGPSCTKKGLKNAQQLWTLAMLVCETSALDLLNHESCGHKTPQNLRRVSFFREDTWKTMRPMRPKPLMPILVASPNDARLCLQN